MATGDPIPSRFNLKTACGRYQARRAGYDVPLIKPGTKPPPMESLISKSSGCWNWAGSINRYGYGLYHVDGSYVLVDRVMWERATGQSAAGWVIMHKCDNPRCCRPDHLERGTPQDNRADAVQKGRQAKGEGIKTSKLTEAQVMEIRASYRRHVVTHKMLAKAYGVSRDLIIKILTREYWKHLE